MKKKQKTPQWIVAKRLRKKAQRTGAKVGKHHATAKISYSS